MKLLESKQKINRIACTLTFFLPSPAPLHSGSNPTRTRVWTKKVQITLNVILFWNYFFYNLLPRVSDLGQLFSSFSSPASRAYISTMFISSSSLSAFCFICLAHILSLCRSWRTFFLFLLLFPRCYVYIFYTFFLFCFFTWSPPPQGSFFFSSILVIHFTWGTQRNKQQRHYFTFTNASFNFTSIDHLSYKSMFP